MLAGNARIWRAPVRKLRGVLATCAMLAAMTPAARAQTHGFATLPEGTLNYTIASAVAKVLKEKAGLNVQVQPTVNDQVIVPMVNSGAVDIGITNVQEIHNAYAGNNPGGRKLRDLRIIATANTVLTTFWVRMNAPMKTIADLKGKRVSSGYTSMRVFDTLTRAILATGGLTSKNVRQMLVSNMVRSADLFVAGGADMFFFTVGDPKVRKVGATVGGIRALAIDPKGAAVARKISKWGYLVKVRPGPNFVGASKPTYVYAFDNVFFTGKDTKDAFVYKFLATLEKNKRDLAAAQVALHGFSVARGYKKYDVPYHPGALKYFKAHKIRPMAVR